MIEIQRDALVLSFPEIHREAKCSIVFQRTLRIPAKSGRYPVPPGLGRFKIDSVKDYAGGVPSSWLEGESVFFPMYQAEALWVIFVGWYPFAIKVAAGDINAVTGRKLHDERLWRPRDYVVVPRQPWMEWFCVGNGTARQFVAMPLKKGGDGEGGMAHSSLSGPIQITAYPMKAERYREYRHRRSAAMSSGTVAPEIAFEGSSATGVSCNRDSFGDEYGFGAWELTEHSRCNVYPVNSLSYLGITGHCPSGRAPTAAEYSEAGLPWFDFYGRDSEVLGSGRGRAF